MTRGSLKRMADTTRPGDTGTFPAGDRHRLRGGETTTGDIPCPGDRTYQVQVSVASAQGSEADLNALYGLARRLLDLRVGTVRCAPPSSPPPCNPPHRVELQRRWSFASGKITMIVADRVHCLQRATGAPTGVSLPSPGTFATPSGSEGSSPAVVPQNTAELGAGPGLRMACGPERLFESRFTYPSAVECEAITDYAPYIARAEQDAKAILGLLGCPPGCGVKQFRFPWKRWSCRRGVVTIELATIMRCTRPVTAPGCLPGLFARLTGRGGRESS